jgi:arabinose-5-phosphate isomerase
MSKKSQIIRSAVQVIELEKKALQALASNIPEHFEDVVNLIVACTGRVVVSAVGKSGHIGCKIAATLASTGTPAHFVHATEASHGDLGLVTQNDICILISKSGGTTELKDIIAHTRRFEIPLVCITSTKNSVLHQAADYRLLLPDIPEACAIGKAPTTSTTMTLAIGDALAVSLMQKRQFKEEHFAVFHPGGKLGAHLAKVGDVMRPTSEMAIVSAHDSMESVVLEMSASGYGIAVVIEPTGNVTGVISDGDLRRNIDKVFLYTAGQIASSAPVTIGSSALAKSALTLMEKNGVYVLVVVEEKKPIGLLRMHDLLKAGIA